MTSKKTATINNWIDAENGFARFDIPSDKGGCLYVSNGEEIIPLIGQSNKESKGAIIILGQDYHPRNHISFMTNHPGIMEYRMEKFKAHLTANQQPEITDKEELYKACQAPVHFFNGFDKPPVPFPFEEIVLNEKGNIIGLKEADGRIRKVEVETTNGKEPSKYDRGRVSKVLDDYHEKTFDEYRAAGTRLSTQTLWTEHCIQGTESCLYPEGLNLPKGLVKKLEGDLTSPIVTFYDKTSDNTYHVIRKGMNPELDSYGIGFENDRKTKTAAHDLFEFIAEDLENQGYKKVIVNLGGLATNFCVEFSSNHLSGSLLGNFKNRGIEVETNLVVDACRGIPIPGGKEVPFSNDGAILRMEETGFKLISGKQHLESIMPNKEISGPLDLKTSQKNKAL